MHLIDTHAYQSRLRRRHPAEKLLLSVGALLLVLALPVWPASVIFFASMSGAILYSGVSPSALLRLLRAPLGFALFGALPLLVGVSGDGVALSSGGLMGALSLLMRASAAFTSLLFLSLSTPLPELLSVLRAMRAPAVLLEMMLVMYRMIFLFIGELSAMSNAQEARLGYSSARASMRSASMLGSALWVRTLHRAQRTEIGLAARGYQGELSWLPEERLLSWSALGCIVASLSLASAVSLLCSP